SRVHRDSAVSEDRLWAHRGDSDLAAVIEFVEKRPDLRLAYLALYLQLGEGGLAGGIPVDDPLAPVDLPLVVELYELSPDRLGEIVVHRELQPAPVRTDAKRVQLPDDLPAELLFPLPDTL